MNKLVLVGNSRLSLLQVGDLFKIPGNKTVWTVCECLSNQVVANAGGKMSRFSFGRLKIADKKVLIYTTH